METVSEGSLLVVWNCTTVITPSHDNNTTFSSERATFDLESLVLSFKSPTTWLITISSARSIQSTTLRHAAWLCYARKSGMELTLSIVALYRQSVPLYPHLSKRQNHDCDYVGGKRQYSHFRVSPAFCIHSLFCILSPMAERSTVSRIMVTNHTRQDQRTKLSWT